MTTKPKHNAVALFSASNEDKEVSLEERQNILRHFAEAQSLTIVSFLMVTKEVIWSGFEQALTLCTTHGANTVIFDDLATLSLPGKKLSIVFEMLAERKISLVFVRPSLILEAHLLFCLNQLLKRSFVCDQDQRSRRIKKSLNALKQKGGKLGAKRFGDAAHEAKIIYQIVKLHREGASLQKICEMLAANEIKTVLHKKWHPTTVKRIIERNKHKKLAEW